MSSTTQLIYKQLLQMPVFTPPKPKGKEIQYGLDDKCWLCGGDTEQLGWHLKDGITTSFTDGNIAKFPTSQTLCYSCVALMKKEAWVSACEMHGHNPYFPTKDGKSPTLSSWMFSSHVFSVDGWLRPERKELAEILLNPPKPPFVITIAEVGKKHVIFRAKVNYSQDRYFVSIDDEPILIQHDVFTLILSLVEQAYCYFSKDSILTGNYNQAAIMKVGLNVWRKFEDKLKDIRGRDFNMLRVACFIARKAD